MSAKPYRESPRLAPTEYEGPLAAHVVIVTRERTPIFSDPRLAEVAIGWLCTTAGRYAATLHAYCVMPDHLHVLIEIPEGVSLQRIIRWFKQMSGYDLKRATGSPAWQVSYYDHVLRHEEALEDVARYVWNNPVAAGLVDDWTEYALSGPREQMESYGAPSQV